MKVVGVFANKTLPVVRLPQEFLIIPAEALIIFSHYWINFFLRFHSGKRRRVTWAEFFSHWWAKILIFYWRNLCFCESILEINNSMPLKKNVENQNLFVLAFFFEKAQIKCKSLTGENSFFKNCWCQIFAGHLKERRDAITTLMFFPYWLVKIS